MSRINKSKIKELAKDFEYGINVKKLRDKYQLGNRALLHQLIEARKQGLLNEEIFTRILVDKTQHDFPENLENRLEAILSCMNSELKQATLLTFDRDLCTGGMLKNRVATLTNQKLPHRCSFSEYCTLTFSPIGFLIDERFGKGLELADHYFTLSESGKHYGQPIAAFSLRYAVENNISLYELLGQTASSGDSRAPYNRVRMFELITNGHNQIANLGKELGIHGGDVREHLKQMQKLGFLSFDSLNLGECERNIYTWTENQKPKAAKTVLEYKRLTQRVAQWLFKKRKGDYHQIARELKYKCSANVSTILSGLEKQGFASSKFPSNKKSKITLYNKTSEFLENYVKHVRCALEDKDELKNMQEMFKEFERNRNLFEKFLDAGIGLYREISPSINSQTLAEREDILLKFIKNYQDKYSVGPRPRDIGLELNWNNATVSNYIRPLFKRGSLIKEREGNAVRYSLKRKE